MQITHYALIFFGLTTVIFVALYWHTAAKLAELVLATRLDNLEQDLHNRLDRVSTNNSLLAERVEDLEDPIKGKPYAQNSNKAVK